MATLSERAVSQTRAYIEKLENARNKIKAKAEEKAGEMKTTLEVQGACAVSCYVIGRIEQKTGKPAEVFGLPVDLVAGAGLVAAAMLDLTGKYDEDALNMGNGVLAGYVARKAYAMGQSAQTKGNIFGAVDVVSGMIGAGGMRSADSRLADEIRSAA